MTSIMLEASSLSILFLTVVSVQPLWFSLSLLLCCHCRTFLLLLSSFHLHFDVALHRPLPALQPFLPPSLFHFSSVFPYVYHHSRAQMHLQHHRHPVLFLYSSLKHQFSLPVPFSTVLSLLSLTTDVPVLHRVFICFLSYVHTNKLPSTVHD